MHLARDTGYCLYNMLVASDLGRGCLQPCPAHHCRHQAPKLVHVVIQVKEVASYDESPTAIHTACLATLAHRVRKALCRGDIAGR